MRRLLPRAAARAVLGGAPEHRASAALIFDRPSEGQVVFETIDWNDRRHRLFFEANRPFVSEQSPLEDALTEDPVQMMFTGGCAAMRGLFDGLRDCGVSGRSRGTRSPSPSTSTATFRSSMSSRLAARRGRRSPRGRSVRACRRARSWPIGDNLNDLEMLEFAGTPVVMGNAHRRPERRAAGP